MGDGHPWAPGVWSHPTADGLGNPPQRAPPAVEGSFMRSTVSRMLLTGVLGAGVFPTAPLAATPPVASAAADQSPRRELNIMAYGAAGDGRRSDTRAIQAAIDDCSRLGGRLIFPAGRYLTGTFYLRKNVELHLTRDAVILGSTQIADYATDTGGIRYDTPWMDRCLVYAAGADHIAITGEGTLDGQGTQENFPPGKLRRDRPMLLRFYNCRNVVLRDCKLRNPASWTTAIIACENVDVRNLTIDSRANWNGDGLDFDSCRNVTVDQCTITASDDCICLQASEKDRPCENVTITRCRLSSRWAAIRIGLLTRSDIRNVVMRDCHFHDTQGAGFKLQMAEGAVMENMRFENITMDQVVRPLFLTLNRHRFTRELKEAPLPPPGTLRNIKFVNIKARAGHPAVKDAKSYMVIAGVPGKNVEDIEFRDMDITFPGGGTTEMAHRRDVPELGDFKPEFFEFKGDLPAYGLFIRHAAGIRLNNVSLSFAGEEKRPAIVWDDVTALDTSGLRAQCAAGVQAVVKY